MIEQLSLLDKVWRLTVKQQQVEESEQDSQTSDTDF